MKYPLIYARALNEIWMASPETVKAVLSLAEHGPVHPRSESKEEVSAKPIFQVAQGLAIHAVSGIIGKRLAAMDIDCGGYDLEMLRSVVHKVENDNSIWGLFLQMDTPGGACTGCPEMADEISSMKKPVFTYTDTINCSAGIYVTSGATQHYASSSCTYGSIGCYSAILDWTKNLEKEGIEVKILRSGRLKGEGAYGTSYSEETIKAMQDQVIRIGEDFRNRVRKNRPGVSEESMEGQAFTGDEAKSFGLVDAIFPTPEAAISHILKIKGLVG